MPTKRSTEDWVESIRTFLRDELGSNLQIVKILNKNICKVAFTEIETDRGHDSFLLDEVELDKSIKGFLDSNYDKIKKL